MQITSGPRYIFAALPSLIVRFKMSMANPSNLEFYARNSGIAMAHLRLPILSAQIKNLLLLQYSRLP